MTTFPNPNFDKKIKDTRVVLNDKHQRNSADINLDTITKSSQSLLIWWTGAELQELPEHLKKSYAGLGGMTFVSTILAASGGFGFVMMLLNSLPISIIGAILSGGFMWGFDRSILGFVPKKESSRTFWIKLLVNVTFSSILTLPLAMEVLSGSIKEKEMKNITDQIEVVEEKIDKNKLDEAAKQANLDKINKNSSHAYKADGTVNEPYVKDRLLAIKAVENVQQQEGELRGEIKELKEDKKAYERGDLSKVGLSFPQRFQYFLEDASLSDKILSSLFLTVSIAMGTGAIIAKTFVMGSDSYASKWRRKEDEALDTESFAYVRNSAISQVNQSIFNPDLMDGRIKTKVDSIQREYEDEIVMQVQRLHDARLVKMRQQVEKQAKKEDLSIDFFNLKNPTPNPSYSHNEHSRYDVEPVVSTNIGREQISKDAWQDISEKALSTDSQLLSENEKFVRQGVADINDSQVSEKYPERASRDKQNNSNKQSGSTEDFVSLFQNIDNRNMN